MSNNGLLIVLSGPSGSGKDTVLERLINLDSNVVKAISTTTRQLREGEINGKDYFFISEQEFFEAIKNKELLEYTNYCGNYYGTLKNFVKTLQNDKKDVILKIEVEGATQIKEKCPDVLRIFILPPSINALKKRLSGRGTETTENLEKRLDSAKKEIKASLNYDYIVVNDDADECAKNILSIITAEKLKSCRMKNIVNEVF